MIITTLYVCHHHTYIQSKEKARFFIRRFKKFFFKITHFLLFEFYTRFCFIPAVFWRQYNNRKLTHPLRQPISKYHLARKNLTQTIELLLIFHFYFFNQYNMEDQQKLYRL